ncbi:leucine rich repeat -containing protein, partial [Chrysochromulina tobinii]
MAPSVTPERDLASGAAGGGVGVGGSETMLAAKTLGLRKDFDLNSAELPAKLLAGTVVTVHETRTMPDGSKRARITSLDGKIAGIITSISKEGAAGLVLPASNQLMSGMLSALGGGQADDVRVLEVITPSPMILRATAEVHSEKLGELFGGSRIFTLETVSLRDGTVRVRVGDVGQGGRSLGWVTITSKAGIHTAYHPLSVVSAPKQIVVRSGFENKSAEVGNLEPGTRVHVLESEAVLEAERLEANRQAELRTQQALREMEAARLEIERKAAASLDTVRAMCADLEKRLKRAEPVPDETLYERREAHRPSGRDEAKMPSRHAGIPPTVIALMFNSYRATFELVLGDLKTMPDSGAYELRSLVTHQRLGSVKIAPVKNAPLVERVEFSDQWHRADEHGVEHDGLHGEATLLLRLDWHLENEPGALHTAIIKVTPWLAYGCGEGARLAVRCLGAIEGKCATVQRALRDDSVVIKFDGLMGDSSVDPSPLTVVRAYAPRHAVGTRLLFLHNKRCVDAVVEKWDGDFDVKEGTRHAMLLPPVKTTGWVTMRTKEGSFNLRELEGKDDGDGRPTFTVISYKPLMVREGLDPEKSNKAGLLAPKTLVTLFEKKELKDGSVRAHVTTIKGANVVLAAALNEFNHSIQRFGTASEYEAARVSYCEDMMSREEFVEDAITGNMLRIKDQTLHVSTATDLLDNKSIPAEWKINDPVLMRAGPGTGKTWMIKQAAFVVAEALRETRTDGGIRLVPMVMYVQRIVFLIREGGAKGGLLMLYIESVYAGKKAETWRKMLIQAFEMRALIVLIDGVDEAAGLRDEIEYFIHQELVPSGNRVLVTSRPEGVNTAKYKGRFVIMNLNALSNEQQRAAVSVQMHGSEFFEHLLSLGEVRKKLDEVYDKFRDSTQHDLEELVAPCRFLLPGMLKEQERPYDPKERQHILVAEVTVSDSDAELAAALAALQSSQSIQSSAAATAGAASLPSLLAPSTEGANAVAPSGAAAVNTSTPSSAGVSDTAGTTCNSTAATAATTATALTTVPAAVPVLEEVVQTVVTYTYRIVRKRPLPPNTAPKSLTLHAINRTLLMGRTGQAAAPDSNAQETTLDLVDQVVSTVPPQAHRSMYESAMRSAMGELAHLTPASRKVAMELGLMLRKEALVNPDRASRSRRAKRAAKSDESGNQSGGQAAALWNRIMERTDEVYLAAEELSGTFRKVVELLAHEEGHRATRQVELPAYKDPVRLVAKAQEEYSTRFSDGGLPEACVTDVVRARVKCQTGPQAHLLLARICRASGVLEVDTKEALVLVELFDLANKFHDLDPTHFRYATCTLKLTYQGKALFGEVEVHVTRIAQIGHDPSNQAYEHYNFFRNRLLGTVPEEKLNQLLEEKLVFLVDATGVPVLLSLLVLIFTAGGEDLTKLPSNRIELYELGIQAAMTKRLQTKASMNLSISEASDIIIRRWMMLFNLDRSQMTADDDGGGLQEKKREKRASRKETIKFDELTTDTHKKDGEKDQTENRVAIKLDSKEVYEVFRHGHHYLREAAKPEVQRTELNRIELSMPKKLVDTVMLLVNGNLKMLLGGKAHDCGIVMLRNVAVINQQNGRREFSSAHASNTLLLEMPNADAFTMWLHLDKEEAGIPLTKTLEVQTETSAAQYQFKHLSFQEGLFAQYLLIMSAEGWAGWASDELAAKFLNDPFMNNTCRIAAGHLGSLLAKRRPTWDFSAKNCQLQSVGLYALWLLMERNTTLQRLVLRGNKVGQQYEDAAGLARMFSTSTALTALDLSNNMLGSLRQTPAGMRQLARGLSTNKSLTDVNLASNLLWPEGLKAVCSALRSCTALRTLDLSDNHPGREPALSELVREHTTLQSLAVVEKTPLTRIEKSFHLDARAKEAIGYALLESTATMRYLQCDNFSLKPETTTLTWTSDQQSDSVLLAGALKTNHSLTAINVGSGPGELGDFERDILGRAILRNLNGNVGYSDLYDLKPDGPKAQTFDFKDKTQIRSFRSFVFFAGLMRGNARLISLELIGLNLDHIPLLAEALRTNVTLQELRLVHMPKLNERTVATLPVQDLNGHNKVEHINLWEAGISTIDSQPEQRSYIQRAAVAMGVCSFLTALKLGHNKLTDAGVGQPLVDVLRSEQCKLSSLDLSNNELTGAMLARAVQSNTSLTSLDFRGNTAVDDNALWVLGGLLLEEDCQCRIGVLRTYAFDVLEGATEFSMRNTALALGAARLLVSVFRFNDTITDLDLSNVGLVVQASHALAKALRTNTTLTKLDISHNPLSDVSKYTESELEYSGSGFRAFAAAVRASASLQSLTFAGNFEPMHLLQIKGAAGVGHAKVLDLSGKGFDPLSAILIGQLIAEHTILTELSLLNNVTLGTEGARTIVDRVHAPTLRTLDLNSVIPPPNPALADTPKGKRQAAQLERFCRSLGRLTALEKLTLDKNALVEFSAVGQLHNLKTITINNNRLETLHDDICFLRHLKRLSVRSNKLLELPYNIGKLESLESLDLKGNRLTYLPPSIGQLGLLKHLDVSENLISQLEPTICDCIKLDRFEVKQNPLVRPPLSIAKQGVVPIRRYFQELNRSGEARSQGARLVLLGHGEAGKTSLQRGLRYGAPHPADKDERTVQLDISTLVLGEGESQVILSAWDLGGQVHYAALLQPYIVTGSLYLLLVPCFDVAELEARYDELLGRWLDYLQVGAPEAVVQLVLTKCDAKLRRDKEWSVFYIESQCKDQMVWLERAVQRHQDGCSGKRRLKVQPGVACVCSVAGGNASLSSFKSRLELIVLAKPALLPSVGMPVPRTWLLAMSFLRAIRDGRQALRAVKATLASQETIGNELPDLGTETRVAPRPYITIAEARRKWQLEVQPTIEPCSAILDPEAAILDDALTLLINQGELFAGGGVIFLQPDHVTRLLKPLVDHRLGTSQSTNPLELMLSPAPPAALTPTAMLEIPQGEIPQGGTLQGEIPQGEIPLGGQARPTALTTAERHLIQFRGVQTLAIQALVKEEVVRAWHGALLGAHEALLEPEGTEAEPEPTEQLGIIYPIGYILPPGIAERLMGALHGFGTYYKCWREGALLKLDFPRSTHLLIELRVDGQSMPEAEPNAHKVSPKLKKRNRKLSAE